MYVRFYIGTYVFLYSYRCQSAHAAAGRVLRSRHCFSLPLAGMCYQYACMCIMHTCMYACVSRHASLFFPDVFSLPPSFLPASLPQPVPTTYLTDFKKAYLTFQHQRVYDPERECLDTLKPLPPGLQVCVVWGLFACDMCRYADISICMCDMYACLSICACPHTHTHPHTQTEDMPYIGSDLSQEVAQAISSGRMHPCTRQYWEDVVDAATGASLPPEPPLRSRGDFHSVERSTPPTRCPHRW